MEASRHLLELDTEGHISPSSATLIEESPQAFTEDKSPCERAIDLVTEELREATDTIDSRAKRFASFIVLGLVEGHFGLDSDQPNPVHKRIHGILGKLNEQKRLPKEIAMKLFGPASEA